LVPRVCDFQQFDDERPAFYAGHFQPLMQRDLACRTRSINRVAITHSVDSRRGLDAQHATGTSKLVDEVIDRHRGRRRRGAPPGLTPSCGGR
jgi:hypothetical protein